VAEYTQESPKRATLSTDGRGCVARSLKKRATERHFNPHQTSFLRVSLGRQWSENQMLRTGGYIIQKNLCTKGKTSAYNLSNKHCIHDKTKLTGKKNKQGKKRKEGPSSPSSPCDSKTPTDRERTKEQRWVGKYTYRSEEGPTSPSSPCASIKLTDHRFGRIKT
jgi:hypothetical protein